MNVLLKRVVQRVILLVSSFILQIGVISFFLLKYSESFFDFYLASLTLSIIIVFIIINNKSNPSYKIAWIVPVMIFPIFGGLFYLLYGGNKLSTREKLKMVIQNIEMTNSLKQDDEIIKKIGDKSIYAKNQSEYILNYAKCPVYNNTETTYFKIGEEKFEALLRELKKAEKFIFLEYFIIQEGKMFNSILEILEEKAKQGVDVRLIYDDVGCIVTLPHNYKNTLEAKGIKCRVFNPIKPFFTRRLNNRDHRKIVVIDGDVGFTGGINLADEYINEYEKHGYWKDAGIMLKGDAVWNLTVMFLSMWDYIDNKEEDYIKFKPSKNKYYNSKGYVQPFDDSPLINEPIGETVYLNLINKAKDYIYINTPYLIIDNEMATALKIAAKSGVDIKIVTPYIPDKKFVHAVTKSYYESFIKDGIEIYEFTPGFMHAKTFVVDNEYGVVGSINLDFRSLYLHYECGVWLYKTDSIKSMKDDYLETLKRCHKVTMEECKNTSSIRKVLRLIIRMFAPLL
ncbi:cardiolipin synthase [Intestinibacter bartlettii]|uniref:Cardiolipin synthase n=1 Tax=Intestinibacter bartlettii CAG:1329 TaxID=1263063 RepID=R5X1N5_9FIRM|nr:cardiolipin synthase [Intestinibacter bartlettii]CDA09633.1 phospholipase D domain protein [Intestinibacter bartlettii CAG:1329]